MKGRLGVRGTKGPGRTKATARQGDGQKDCGTGDVGRRASSGDLRARRKLCGKENQRRGPRRCSQTDAHGRASGEHEADMSGAVELSRQIEMRSGCVCKDAFDCGIVERSS
ncbi:hypothetical protein ERJ75_000221800 [Trypanosoma vivax]|nr:hypothetical protein ERJ75_000221800 [Trypanosoma vivax]